MGCDNKTTAQMRLWQGAFGKRYTDRNTYSPADLDRFYRQTLGHSLRDINHDLLRGRKIQSALEVGCNIGMKLKHLQQMGYKNLYGIELQADAVERSKSRTKGINILQGSAFDIPFKDGFFDLVYTNGVLIHLHPKDLKQAMREMARCSRKYVMGLEYYSESPREIPYHGRSGALWKNDFAAVFLKYCPEFRSLRTRQYPYRKEPALRDVAYLLGK